MAAAAVRRVETRPIEDVVEWQLQVAIVYQGCPSIDSNCHRLPSSTARSTIDLIIRDAYVIQYGAPSITCGYYVQNNITTKPNQPRISNGHLPPPPLAIATRILYSDGADPYIQVPRVDCAYGVDE